MITKVRSLVDTVRGRLVMIAHEDRGSSAAEMAVVTGILVAIAVLVGKVFGTAIVAEANKVAKQITSQ
ncbi:hypothetical protein [Catenulispora pinisilvae]|uniref:hypothetical protein n=1 Tax=Catenulispora pinisilvae TaxID=2705253 RepID=UPI001890DBAA|nr:hypothetical protein [Catenulispora pinisilvae]